jgi:hypothetical protein
MVHIEQKALANGGVRYEVRYGIGGGDERSKTFRTKAKAFQIDNEASRNRGGFVDPRAGSSCVARLATEWLKR